MGTTPNVMSTALYKVNGIQSGTLKQSFLFYPILIYILNPFITQKSSRCTIEIRVENVHTCPLYTKLSASQPTQTLSQSIGNKNPPSLISLSAPLALAPDLPPASHNPHSLCTQFPPAPCTPAHHPCPCIGCIVWPL